MKKKSVMQECLRFIWSVEWLCTSSFVLFWFKCYVNVISTIIIVVGAQVGVVILYKNIERINYELQLEV